MLSPILPSFCFLLQVTWKTQSFYYFLAEPFSPLSLFTFFFSHTRIAIAALSSPFLGCPTEVRNAKEHRLLLVHNLKQTADFSLPR